MAAQDKPGPEGPVSIDSGAADWQVVQQDANGQATIVLNGRWKTVLKRKKPEVRVRLCREGGYSPVRSSYDWARATTSIDRSIKGPMAGRSGTWRITLKDVPCGGPYRIDTIAGSAEDAIEWRSAGETVHFVCVGDVWLIAGQSNAEGYGRDPVDDPSEMGVHMLTESGWALAAHGIRHNPWLSFAKQLHRELGYPIGIVPTAVGGSAVSEWDPGQNGVLFKNMKQRLAAAENRIRGCVWYQGESDVGEKEHPRYAVRFTRLLKGLRRLVKTADLPIITVQLNRALGKRLDGEGWEAIRETQRRLSHELDGLYVCSIFEAGLCDGIHISSIGNLLIAQRAATIALGGVYGRDIHCLHPECVSARQISRKAIALRFDNVVERLDYECPAGDVFPFAVRDNEGEVPVTGFSLPRKNVFRIELGRALAGASTVVGAPGCCPPTVVPRDIGGYRGMLAFSMNVQMK